MIFFFGKRNEQKNRRRYMGQTRASKYRNQTSECELQRKYTSFTRITVTIGRSRRATECNGSIESAYGTTTVAGIMRTARGRRLHVRTQNNHGVAVGRYSGGFFQPGVRGRQSGEQRGRARGGRTRRWETSRPAGRASATRGARPQLPCAGCHHVATDVVRRTRSG